MNRLLQFDGRATRSEYWHFAIIHNTIKVLVTMIEFSWYGMDRRLPLHAYFTISGELSLGYAVLAFIPCLAITIRRFHDIGVSGACFILLHIPFIGPLLFLGLGFIGSKKGENKYGPHPDAPSTLSQEAGKDEPKEAGKGMMKRITALLLLISILLGVPVSADTGMPLRVFLGDSLLQGPDKDLPVEVVLSSYWEEDRKMFRATWTMPSGRPVEINSELYPSTRSIEEEHFLVGRASSRGNHYHAELMRVDRYPFQVTEEGDWEASEDITLFIPFTDKETETEYFLVSSLTEDQYQQLHQRSVVNYDGYVSAYNDYRRDYEPDFNPEGNTDYQEDYYWKLYYSERPDDPTETTRLTFQGPSIHVNSEGEVVHGFSDKASAPMAAAEPLGLMSFSDGSPSAANTSITIKSLDDFQNFDQFRAFLEAVDNGLHFSDGTATVEVVYRSGRHDTLLIYKELFFAPVARGKALESVYGDNLRIVVQERGTSRSPTNYGPGRITGAVFSVLESRSETKQKDQNTRIQKLEVSEVHQILALTPNYFKTFPTTNLNRGIFSRGSGHPIKRVEMVRSIDYGPYEGYVSRLEQMLLDLRGDNEINTELDAFVAVLQNLTENPRDHENMPYYLPPVIVRKKTNAFFSPTILSFGLPWISLFPYGEYVTIILNKIPPVMNTLNNQLISSLTNEVYYSAFNENNHPSIVYGQAFSSQVINKDNNVFTPTLDQTGKIRKGLVRQVGLQIEHGYLLKRGDRISFEIEMMTLPDDLSKLMEHFTEEQQAQLLDENTGLKPLPYKIHTDYSMVIGGKVHYFDNTGGTATSSQ